MSVITFPNKSSINSGAVVILRSGGSNMLVEKICGVDVQCIWINNENSIGRGNFKLHTLSLVSAKPDYNKQTLQWSNCETGEKL